MREHDVIMRASDVLFDMRFPGQMPGSASGGAQASCFGEARAMLEAVEPVAVANATVVDRLLRAKRCPECGAPWHPLDDDPTSVHENVDGERLACAMNVWSALRLLRKHEAEAPA